MRHFGPVEYVTPVLSFKQRRTTGEIIIKCVNRGQIALTCHEALKLAASLLENPKERDFYDPINWD